MLPNTLPPMEHGKQRRPGWMRADIAPHDPREDPHPNGGTMGRVAFFRYREDAVAAAREWCEPDGWRAHPQYVGRYDLWVLEASRKSWGHSKAPILVEACLSPDKAARVHAHVPDQHSFGRMAASA